MVQPIEYTPQFIKTDVGAIQDKLNARQGQYDAAYASTLGAEDKFGEFNVHQKDVDLKNKVIGGFKDRVKTLVDQYGGDYAAASKQLVKEIVNTKNDKFFGLAAERNKLAEEQRRLVQQYGPGAIIIKDVTKPDLVDAKGNYIRPEDLTSDVISRKQLTDLLDEDHGLLKNKSREANVASDRAGYYKSITTQGITNAEVESTRNAMFNTLKKNKPELSDDMAMNIADAQARSYVLGSKSDYLSDKNWDLSHSGSGNPPPPPNITSLITPEVYGNGQISETGVSEYNTAVGIFNKAASDIPRLKTEIPKLKTSLDFYQKSYDDAVKNNDPNLIDRKASLDTAKRKYESSLSALNSARKNYTDSENTISKKYSIYNDIKNKPGKEGGALNAWKAIENKINEANAVYPSGLAFRENANTVNSIIKEYSNEPGSMMTIDPETGRESNAGKTFLEITEGDSKKITKAGVLPGSGKMFVEVGGVKYTLPVASSKNSVLRNMQVDYDKIKEIYSGSKGIGLFKLVKGSDGKYTAYKYPEKTQIYSDKDGKYIRVIYKNGKILSEIVNVKDGAGSTTDLAGYTDAYGNQVAEELGSKVEVEPIKVRPE